MDHLQMRRPDWNGIPEVPVSPGGYTLAVWSADQNASLADLLRVAFEDETWIPERVTEALVDDTTVYKTFVVEHAGIPIATASARLLPDRFPGLGYLHWVAVSPEHTGKRLGALVSLAVLHDFIAQGCHGAVLETQDFRLPAIKTYLNLGFVPELVSDTQSERWEAIQEKLSASG